MQRFPSIATILSSLPILKLLQPEQSEIKKIAAEGILTCLQDAIDSLEQKEVLLRLHLSSINQPSTIFFARLIASL